MKIKRKVKKLIAAIMASLMVCLFVVPQDMPKAKDSFISQYIQNVYNQNNGIGSNEVNCLYQSSSGYIWIGTDGGLYRYNGSSFSSINLWDTDRSDIYSINSIMQDSKGRMWIGTDNYGLFYIENGENHHFQDEYYSGTKTIYDVCEVSDGEIYVAADDGLYMVSENKDDITLAGFENSNISDKKFSDIESYEGTLWGIYDTNKIGIIEDGQIVYTMDTSSIMTDDICSLNVSDNKVFVGTTGKNIIVYTGKNKSTMLSAGVEGINRVMEDALGNIWVCGDNGLGYFDGTEFVRINDSEIDSYLSDIIQDYEGNYWISSTRMGVLQLAKGKFTDYNMYTGMSESMVNAVCIYGTSKYIGTDDGLVIYDRNNERINNELTDMLSGISIRYIMPDSEGNIWISTYRKFGVVRVGRDKTILNIGRGAGLPSAVINATLELSNGNIAVATDDGIGIIDKEGNVISSYDEADGIEYTNVSCLYEDEDGILYLGTEGGGIYTIDMADPADIINYTMDDGLNSDVVTSMEEGKSGLWIGTDNGICLYNEAFRAISNVEYSNSIYDILVNDEDVWIIGSMGVLRTNEEELMGSQGIKNRYYDATDGLTKTLNTINNSAIDGRGVLYICCNSGICTLDTNNIPTNTVPPVIKVTSIEIDGKLYEFDDLNNGLKVKSDVTKITIDFAVFSYTNRDDIVVEYSLNGFDKEPIILSGTDSMKAVYTNLAGGVYEFEVSAYNGDGVLCEEPVSFIIEKETSFFEDPVARAGMVAVLFLMLVLLVLGILRLKSLIANKNIAIEKLSKEHEEAVKSSSAKNDYLANMSNEIKTPINAMIAKADELLHVISDEDSRDKINSICRIGNGIIGKVDDIILLAKIEAGKVDTIKAPYSITTMIYELSEIAMEKIGDKTVKFFVEIGEDITDNVIGDGDKIKDIIGRLLDNAIKYTKAGSVTLSVDCYKYTDKSREDIVNVVFTVSDTGIGIQDDRIDSIFEVYNIADNVKNSIHAGNGVGLAIAKGYASLMEGDVEVESTYGAGSTFTLTVNQKMITSDKSSINIAKIEETVSKEDAEKLWLPDVNALLVDDDDVSRDVSYKVLSRFEMKVDVASSGINAIDMVMNNDYDVVFMDLSMPIMNGIDAMEEIRELEDDKYTVLSIIAMDTDAIEGNKEKLLSVGFTDSVVKPMDIRRVAAILKDCLPQSLIKEKTNDIIQYIEGSRYKEGLDKLREYMDVEYAIEKIGGSIDVFNKLVRLFYEQNAAASEELYKKAGKDVRGFKIKIHSLKTTSMNIGAMDLAHQATKMEGAINIGNREYINDNLEKFLESLVDVLLAVEDYVTFADTVSGMSDEEYAAKRSGKNEDDEKEDADIFRMLEEIKKYAKQGDYKETEDLLNILISFDLEGEDTEFVETLRDVVLKKDKDSIVELVDTYFALKM